MRLGKEREKGLGEVGWKDVSCINTGVLGHVILDESG